MSSASARSAARFAHVSLIAEDWRRLADFYRDVFGCIPIPPERDLQGTWLDRATGISGARIRGIHLRLPGFDNAGPTLEIFEYAPSCERTPKVLNELGFAHVAFAVEDVRAAIHAVLEGGGSLVGELTERAIPGAGTITFQYVADPEGNAIEIQRWSLAAPSRRAAGSL